MKPIDLISKTANVGTWPREVLAIFLLTLGGLLLSIGLYFFGMVSISDSRKTLVFNEMTATMDVQELKYSAERKVNQYRAYLITRNPKFLEEGARAHERYRVKSATMLGRLKDPETIELLRKVDLAEERHKTEFDAYIEELRAKHEAPSREVFESRLKPMRDAMDLAFAALLSHQRVRLEASQERGMEIDRTGMGLAALGAVLSLGLFAALASIVLRTIKKLQQSEAHLSQSREEAAASRRLFESVLEHIPVAVIIGEAPSGKLIFSNNKMQEVWGHPLISSAAISDYAAWKGFHPDGRPYAPQDWPLARAIMHGERIISEETRIERGDGNKGILKLSAAPVRDSLGKIVAGVVICEDYTARKRLEEERIELTGRERAAQEASRLKSIFLANMSHEIRTPINGVLGMAELLADTALNQVQKEFVEAIQISGGALLSVINDILDFSKVEAGKLEFESSCFDFGSLLRHFEKSFSPLMTRKNLDFRIENRIPEPAFYNGDPGRIRQVLNNLVGNALKFTESGSITVSIDLDKTDEGKDWILCSVRDTGPGIEPDTMSKLFSPFMQADSSTSRRFGGTGLGLSICKRLVEMMGGQIDVSSQPGQGSQFWFRIALERADPATSMVRKSSAPIDLSAYAGCHILVAEDNPINSKIAELTLEKMGYTVQLAATGAEVLQQLERESFDLILMDCQMPDVDGYEATQRIRARRERPYYNIPIIAMTASSVKGDRELCLSVGMNDYISKPFKANELAAVLSKWLKKQLENEQGKEKKVKGGVQGMGKKEMSAASHVNTNQDQNQNQNQGASASVERLDMTVVNSLIELGESMSPEFLPDLWRTFADTTPQQIQTMRSAVDARDLKTLSFEAHRLKSASGNMGARLCADLCRKLEAVKAWPEDISSVQTNLNQLELEFKAACEDLAVQFKMQKTGKVA